MNQVSNPSDYIHYFSRSLARLQVIRRSGYWFDTDSSMSGMWIYRMLRDKAK